MPILIVALILLAGWLLGIVGLYDSSVLRNVLLLVGLLLLLIGFLKFRDAEKVLRRGLPPDAPR